jgi:hypothetical protein
MFSQRIIGSRRVPERLCWVLRPSG